MKLKILLPQVIIILFGLSGSLLAADAGDVRVELDLEREEARSKVLERLKQQDFLEPHDPLFFHGRLSDRKWVAPAMTWKSVERPREKHRNPVGSSGFLGWMQQKGMRSIEEHSGDWLTASEYQDLDATLDQKLTHLANLLRLSRRTIIYSGAGISVSANIGQAAKGSAGQKKGFVRAKELYFGSFS